MTNTARLNLPLIAAAQAQKHVTHNEALVALDALVHLAVLSRSIAAPPASPALGARYLVPASPSGAWAGHAGAIAVFEGAGWTYLTPQAGWRAYVADESQLVVFDGTAWSALLRRAATFGINADADTTNRLAVSSPAALFNHAGSDSRLVVNKASASAVGTLQFQTAFAAQAEIGLAGDNDLRFKIKDGTSLRPAMVVKAGTGRVGVGVAEPSAEFEVADTSGDNDCRIQLRADGSQIGQIGVTTTQMFLDTTNEKPLIFYLNGSVRAYFDPNGNVGIGVYPPTARLDVAGPVKVKSYTVSTLPSASGTGAGAIAYVSNEAGGAVLAFSDGTSWRRVTDRVVVS